MSLGIFLFPFRVTRWNTAAQWCMAWCPDAQDASLGVASTPNCGGFFGENLHDDSKKKLSFWGDEALGLGVFSLIFCRHHHESIVKSSTIQNVKMRMMRSQILYLLSLFFHQWTMTSNEGPEIRPIHPWPGWCHPFRSWSSAKRALPTNWTGIFFRGSSWKGSIWRWNTTTGRGTLCV